jgi:predicted AlkP superfamily phosphohydrolase/phosphomutase
MGLAGDDTLVMIASDHGFGPAHKYCSMNIWLLQEGFLKLKRDAATRVKRLMFNFGLTPELAFKLTRMLPVRPARGVSSQPGASKLLNHLFLSFIDIDWPRSAAFSKGNYGQIYINLKGREPDGAVAQEEYEDILAEIISRLRALKDPETGDGWVGEIFCRDELYSGSEVRHAPDIAFLPADMRHLPLGNADFTSRKFMVDAFGISGCHRMDGVMIARGGAVKPGVRLSHAHIYDLAPTLLYLLNRSIPVRYVSAREDLQPAEVEYSDDDNADVIDRLKSLGYVG